MVRQVEMVCIARSRDARRRHHQAFGKWRVLRMDSFEQLLKKQSQVNVMLLAALDELRVRLDKTNST